MLRFLSGSGNTTRGGVRKMVTTQAVSPCSVQTPESSVTAPVTHMDGMAEILLPPRFGSRNSPT